MSVALVEREHALVDERLADLDLGRDLGEREAAVLERADRLAERRALLRVVERPPERRPRRGDPGDRDRQPLLRQVVHQLEEPLALGAEQVLRRDVHVGEEQLGRVLGVQAELLQVAAPLEALHPPLEDEQGHALVLLARVGLHRGDHEVGVDAVRDERLRAVDDVGVAVADRGRLHAREVGADAGLGHRDRGDELARRDARHPARLLLVGAVREEVRHADVVVEAHPETGATDAGHLDLLVDDLVVPEVVGAAAAVLLGQVHPDEAVPTRLDEHVVGDDPGRLPLEVVGDDLLVEPGAEARPQPVVLLFEQRAFHVLYRAPGLQLLDDLGRVGADRHDVQHASRPPPGTRRGAP